ncbi:putative E3 ubiquitin-protein ligase, partial [Coemansia sp. RSA 2603]
KYDRARRRNREARAVPLTSYSAQSTQSELPAFQRTRSTTNAPLPRQQQQQQQQQGGRRPGGHCRMRSNTDSSVSLSSRERAAVMQELEGMQQRSAGHALSPNNPFYASVSRQQGQQDTHTGLGIANLRIGDQPSRPQHNPTRFASLGTALHERPADWSPTPMHMASTADGQQPRSQRSRTTGAWAPPDGPKPPPLAHARNSPRTPAGITCDPSDALMRESYHVPTMHSARDRSANMTDFVPLGSPPAEPVGRLRAASMSAGDLPALGAETGGPATDEAVAEDHVQPVRDSVMGVLSGTAEPSGRPTQPAGRTSLTRTRSSSEAPARRAAPLGLPADHTHADVDCYVGADGVMYPKSGSLVMHQHDWRLVAAAKVMALLHAANMLLPSRARLPVEAFYNAGVDNMDLVADYDAWQARVPDAFAFCQYPFLLSLRAKVQIMQVDAARQMDSKLKEAVISALFQGGRLGSQPHLKLFVRRHCLVEDS